MNEMIEKLAVAANAWFPDCYPSGEGGDEFWGNLVIFEKEDFSNFALEKFVELIVKECVDICEKEISAHTAKVLAEEIRKKFGIK